MDHYKSQFTSEQLEAIYRGEAKIPDYTWHHHQDSGRMQLIPEDIHRQTGHLGGEAIQKGK
ncbi:HNH endonuclease [Testudinibacter sp. TR-2022]|uniref:HNH endonuclease n=1 Tax=Testudinibacter sp. TR-2022 TaxID=2585029 RepID=UPI003FA3A590